MAYVSANEQPFGANEAKVEFSSLQPNPEGRIHDENYWKWLIHVLLILRAVSDQSRSLECIKVETRLARESVLMEFLCPGRELGGGGALAPGPEWQPWNRQQSRAPRCAMLTNDT